MTVTVDDQHSVDRAVVLPVGHYTGAFHPRAGAPESHHSLRIGSLVATLPFDVLAVWATAHRPADAEPGLPWNLAAVTAALRDLDIDDYASVLAEFLEDGLIVEIDPYADDAPEFARAHRVVPLMTGLGNTPDDPLHCGIGLVGFAPVLRVRTLVHDIWQWGAVGDDLWSVCEAYARAGAAGADGRPGLDPRQVLAEFLTALPTLLAVNAAYVDEARRR